MITKAWKMPKLRLWLELLLPLLLLLLALTYRSRASTRLDMGAIVTANLGSKASTGSHVASLFCLGEVSLHKALSCFQRPSKDVVRTRAASRDSAGVGCLAAAAAALRSLPRLRLLLLAMVGPLLLMLLLVVDWLAAVLLESTCCVTAAAVPEQVAAYAWRNSAAHHQDKQKQCIRRSKHLC